MTATATRQTRTTPQSPMEKLGALVLDPVTFSTGLLGHSLWRTQARILRSIAQCSRTAVKACHASSKTFTAADALLWWVSRFDDGLVVTTAPTWTQVERLLWGHVHKAAQGGRVQFPPLNKTALEIGPENYAIGLSTNEGVRFQGWHGRVLVILDEAPGVLPEIWEAIQGIRAGGDVRVLVLGQPMVLGGPFYDAFHDQRASWETFTVSAFDTPNLEGCCLDNGKSGDERQRYGSADPRALNLLKMDADDLRENVRPYLATREWVREMWEEVGEQGSPLWNVKVLGEFPDQSEDSLFMLSWIERAKEVQPGHDGEPLDAGIDVAGPGEDETVVSVRQGPNRIAMQAWLNPDPRGSCAEFLRPFKDRLRTVNIDSNGDGYYFAHHFKDLGYPVRFVNVAETEGVPTESSGRAPGFLNQKAMYYWALRERARTGDLGGIDDKREQAQLTSIQYRHDSRGRVVIEDKKERKKLTGHAPDRAEADMLAFAPPLPVAPRRTGLGSRSYATR